MPRGKGSSCFRLEGGDFVISFGRHRGKTLDQLRGRSWAYLIWVSGKIRVDGVNYVDHTGYVVAKIGIKSEQFERCAHCVDGLDRVKGEATQCDVAGETLVETEQRLTASPEAEKFLRRWHPMYSAWLHIKTEHPAAVLTVQRYLEDNEICYNCGRTKKADESMPVKQRQRKECACKAKN